MAIVTKISPCLWFDNEAMEAAEFYTSIFKNSRIDKTILYSREGFEIHGRPEGSVMTVQFSIEGQTFTGLNGGPVFKFNEAVSFVVSCDTQEEIDYHWDKLSEGGDPSAQQCGWLKDKFGLSWQIVPSMLDDLFVDHKSDNTARAMQAMLKMKKLDIRKLQDAYDGK